MSRLFASGGQSIGASASAVVLTMNIDFCLYDFLKLLDTIWGSDFLPGFAKREKDKYWMLLLIYVCMLSCVWLLATPWIVCSPPGSSVYGILQAGILEGVPFPTPGDLPDPGIEPMSLVSLALSLAGRFFTTSVTWEAQYHLYVKPRKMQQTSEYNRKEQTHGCREHTSSHQWERRTSIGTGR